MHGARPNPDRTLKNESNSLHFLCRGRSKNKDADLLRSASFISTTIQSIELIMSTKNRIIEKKRKDGVYIGHIN